MPRTVWLMAQSTGYVEHKTNHTTWTLVLLPCCSGPFSVADRLGFGPIQWLKAPA